MKCIKLEKSIKNKTYSDYLFRHLFLIISIPLLIMVVVIYLVYYRSENNKNSLVLQSYNIQLQDILGECLTELKEYYLDVTNGAVYQWLNEQKDVPYNCVDQLLEIQNVLRGGRIESYVRGYVYINVQNEWVFSNHGMYDFTQLKNQDMLNLFLNEQEQRTEEVYWLNNSESDYVDLNPYGYGHVELSGWNMILKTLDKQGKMQDMLIVQMNSASILQRIQMYKDAGYDMVWVDAKGILFETDSQLSQIVQKYESDTKEKVENREGYLVTSSYDKANGMWYIIGYNTNRDRWMVVTLLVIALVFIPFYMLFIYAAYKISKRLAEPFLSLSRTKEEQEQHIKTLFITNLLTGEMDLAKTDSLMRKYRYTNHTGYRMLFLRTRDENAILEEIINAFPDNVKEFVFIMPVVYKNSIVILVGGEEEGSTEYKTALLVKELKDFIFERYGTRIRIGISRYFTELDAAPVAAQECQEALLKDQHEEQCEDQDEYFIFLYDDFELYDKEAASVGSIEEEFYDAVAECNSELACHLLKEVLDRIERQGLWGERRVLYIYRLLLGLLQIPQRESVLLTDVFKVGAIRIFEWKEFVFDRVLLEQYITEDIMQPIMNNLREQRWTKGTDIVRKITKIVREKRGDITLTECAEELNYHPSYLSRILKQETGMSFTNVINEEKLKLAKYMLLTTKLSIAEVSERLGYHNVQNFIRFFKNQTNMTPVQFRKEGQNDV